MMTTESEADVRHRAGILGRDAIDLDRAVILSDPKTKYLRGFYNREKNLRSIRDYSTMFEDSGKSYEDSKEDYVYIVGQQNANPYVLAHEFRHRAFSPKEMDEKTNRLYDAFYARNQKELDQVLNDMLPKKREALLKRLDRWAPLIVGREVLQLREEHLELLNKLKEKNIPFPKRIDWDLERKRLIEQYNFRAKNTTRKQLGLGGLASALNRRQQYNQGGEPLTFNQQYHLETIKQKRAMRNSEGQTVTVRAEGFERDGIVYNLPTYDRRGGIIANPLEFFKEDIKSGRIQGYAADKETYSQDKNNMHLHPANIAANKEHKMMEKEVPEEVIMYEEK